MYKSGNRKSSSSHGTFRFPRLSRADQFFVARRAGKPRVPTLIRAACLASWRRVSWNVRGPKELGAAGFSTGLVRWLLFLLHVLLLLYVALLQLLRLLLVALLDLLSSCVIGILLGEPLVVLLLFLLELLMVMFLFGVEPVLLLLVFLVESGVAGVRRSRSLVTRNFLGVSEGRTVGIIPRVWRTIGIVVDAAIGWTLVAPAGFLGGNNS